MTATKALSASLNGILFLTLMLASPHDVLAASGSGGGGEVRLVAKMVSGAASGKADYRERGNRRRLNVEVEDLPGTTSSPQTVFVNGSPVGNILLVACPVPAQQLLCGELELNTQDGESVPVIVRGQIVSIGQNPAVMAGSF